MKKLLLILLAPLYMMACPFDEANIEVTIIAHIKISDAINEGNFAKATTAIKSNQKLYEYFEGLKGDKLYQPLLNASKAKDKVKIKKLLDRSLVLEVEELLDKVEQNFSQYQKSRLLIIKAKKHLARLTQDKKAMSYMKQILKSIGNPGLMGVGKKDSDKAMFQSHKKALMVYIQG